jgi:predicted metalloprotease with PDZ domain
VKDSVYILNWHYLLGFFQNGTDRPYRLEVIRNAEFFGAGTLFKTIKNDSTDVYIAGNYKELIHHPIMYSVPDTTSFEIGETHFTISCAGNDSLFNSEKIRNLIFNPLNEIYGQSVFKQNQYTFLYYSEYSLSPPYLTGLEHPNSTLICYHSALLDNKILISSSIHEYIHALFAPLRIRSEVIDSFNFTTPHCDEFLWFYEGVTEYLAIKTMVNSGYFTTQDFFNELNESYEFYKNINLSKISFNIYGKKEQDLFDNFYTKGSLFAMQLDVEIIRRSNGKTDLSAVMNKLQNQYNPEIPFDSKTFFTDFSKTAGVNIERYLIENTRKKKKVNFPEIAEQTGYTKEYNDTLIWSFKTRKQYLVINQKNDRLEIVLFGSTINKTCNSRKVTIYEINGKPVNWYNYDSLLMPEDGQELSLKAISKDEIIEVKAIPEQILKEKKHLNWSKNSNIESAMANYYWNK